jgi:hypothetical protein
MGDPSITVTNFSHSPPGRRQARQTIDHRYFESLSPSQEAVNVVQELRDRIEQKEAEILRLREALQRDDVIDITQTSAQLKELQITFDRVQKMCADRLDPVESEYNSVIAHLQGCRTYMDTLANACSERRKYLDRLSGYVKSTATDLHDPSVYENSEKSLESEAQRGSLAQFDLDRMKRSHSLELFAEKQLLKLNENLER